MQTASAWAFEDADRRGKGRAGSIGRVTDHFSGLSTQTGGGFARILLCRVRQMSRAEQGSTDDFPIVLNKVRYSKFDEIYYHRTIIKDDIYDGGVVIILVVRTEASTHRARGDTQRSGDLDG